MYFDRVPDEKMRESLKLCGWRFNGYKKCWSNFNNVENKGLADSLVKESKGEEERNRLQSLDRYYFESNDQVIIRENSFYCNVHHKLEDIAGVITVIKKSGKVDELLVPMAYCEDCNLYYILKETYEYAKKVGVIRCQMMSYKQYVTDGFYDGDYSKWRKKGPLKLWGYSVSAEAGLSDEQRHAILEDIVDCGAMSKDVVLSYLDFFARLNVAKHALYVDKWREDRNYIAGYKLHSAKRVIFG